MKMMKKIVCAGCLFLLISFCLQAETFVVASYNIRNANQGDSTNGNGWGQRYPYIAKLVQFHGFEFIYFNLHMDHVGVQARAESAKLILKKIKEQPSYIPVILSGDFNVDQNSESYKLLDSSGVMRDSYEIAEFRYAPNGTFNGFYPDRKTDQRIDHIFLTDDFKVLKYGILTDSYRTPKDGTVSENNGNFPKEAKMMKYVARVPSDHFPVMIVVETGK